MTLFFLRGTPAPGFTAEPEINETL